MRLRLAATLLCARGVGAALGGAEHRTFASLAPQFCHLFGGQEALTSRWVAAEGAASRTYGPQSYIVSVTSSGEPGTVVRYIDDLAKQRFGGSRGRPRGGY